MNFPRFPARLSRRTFLKYGAALSALAAIERWPFVSKAFASQIPSSKSVPSEDLLHNLRYGGFAATVSRLTPTGELRADAELIMRHALSVLNGGAFSRLRVRCGGHSYIGASVGKASYVLDLQPFDAIETLPGGELRIGGGCRIHQLQERLARLGPNFYYPLGDCPTVGVAGYLLGGGISMLSPSLGLGVDRVSGATIVVFNKKGSRFEAEIVRANAQEHPDLFWALLGGGGRFGIVTDLTLRPATVDGGRVYEIGFESGLRGRLHDFFLDWQELCRTLDAATSSKLQLGNFHDLSLHGILRGSGDAHRLQALAKRHGATMKSEPLSLESMARSLAGCRNLSDCSTTGITANPEYFSATSTLLDKPLPPSRPLFDELEDKISEPIGADYAFIQFNRWSGLMRAPNPNASFPFRELAYECQICAKTTSDPAWRRDGSYDSWADETAALLGERKAAFFNHVGRDAAQRPELYFGKSWDRLQAVKRRYDPSDLFDAFTPADRA